VRALYIMGENPMMTEPNLNVTRQHMEQLEFLVAQDLFINESGAFADVFLPATSWAEKEGTFTNTDRRVQRVRRAIAPARPGAPRFRDHLRPGAAHRARLGRGQSAGWSTLARRRSTARWRAWRRCSPASPTTASNRSGLQYPVPDETHPGTPFLFAESVPVRARALLPAGVCAGCRGADEEYPFILTTGRLLEHWHGGTMTRHSQLDALYPEPLVELHEIDAARWRQNGRRRARRLAARG
jgi:predicted molibdopterin-dependent oxidoreductase YjgC